MKPRRSLPSFAWSLDRDELSAYVARQLSFFAPPGRTYVAGDVRPFIPAACRRVEKCFRAIRRKYYCVDGRCQFSHLHGDHYAAFLYLLGNTIHQTRRRSDLADATFILNKMLHGLDAFYAIELPDIFLFIHPVGTVLGNARYRDYFVVYQNCSIGSTTDGAYPQFNAGTVLFAKATVIGNCRVGSNVVFGANSFVLNLNVPSQTTVVGTYPQLRLISSKDIVSEKYFGN